MDRSDSKSATWATLAFLAAATTIYAVSALVARALPGFDHPHVVAAGLAFDLTLTVAFFAWLLPVRSGAWAPASLLAVLVVGVAAARRILPDSERAVSSGLVALGAVAEAALLAWISARSVAALRTRTDSAEDLDLHGRIRRAARAILWNRLIADVAAFELSVLAYALGPRRAPHVPAGASAFAYHRRVPYGPVVAALAMVVAAETYPIHLLLRRWQPTAAWLVTFLGLYTLVYLVADWRAAKIRPHLLDGETLTVRTGLRWSARLSLATVAAVERRAPPRDGGKPLRAALVGGANLWIRLAEPAEAEGPYALRRRVSTIALSVDAPDRFVAALEAARQASATTP